MTTKPSRDWAALLADMEQSAQMARRELNAHYSQCEFDERAAMVWLARWWSKWEPLAGRKRLDFILIALSHKDPGETPHG